MSRQEHLLIKEGEIAPYVLLPGDPDRVEIVAKYWDEATFVAKKREYVTYTGTYKGVPISCVSTGIGCPSTAIALEELARCGAKTFLRIGTCGTFRDGVNNGDMAIIDSAVRLEGTSERYIPLEYPAVADYRVTEALVQAAEGLNLVGHVGASRTADTFYASHSKPGSSFNDYWQSDWKHQFEDLKRANVLAAEMEASVIFVLSRLWGLRAGAVAVVLDNMLEVAGEDGEFNPAEGLDHSADYIENLALVGCEAIKILYEQDQAQN